MGGQISELRLSGADGIVCGALTGAGEVDQVATRRFLDLADGLPFTFHRGFDSCVDLERSMHVLVELGVDRVLTSAGGSRAIDSMDRLARLAAIGGDTTKVLCGGGVRSTNLAELANIPGIEEFHSAARSSVVEPVSAAEVRAMRQLLVSR